jgi:hypothetical protein
MQGQRSHLAQAKKCHEGWQADLDTLCIPSSSNLEFHNKSSSNNNDQTAGEGLGEQPATDISVLDIDWNADAPHFAEPPAPDETPVLEEHGKKQHCDDLEENTQSNLESSKP